jgi:hypothetical protein
MHIIVKTVRDPAQINVNELVTITRSTYLTGTIDNPANMADDKIWAFSALNDTVVATGVVQGAVQ